MNKTIITTEHAPSAIGPYSQAVKAGGFLFVSGQIPINPKTAQLVTGSIKEEATQVCHNLQAILRAAGLDFDAVVKTSIFLQDMNDFAEVNEVYGQFFKQPYPARETVAVKTLPKNVNVEIGVIAVFP